jgi:subtilisin family serine protease
MTTGRIIAVLAWLSAAQAHAEPLPYFYRADGRKAELHVQEDGDALVVPLPGHPQPLRLERQIILRVSDSLPNQSVLSELGLQVVRALADRPHTWILNAEDAKSALHACARLVELDLAVWAVPNFHVPVGLSFRPDDRFYGLQWHLFQTSDGHISVEGAWDLTRGNSDVVVAILDTGVDSAHEDLDTTRMVSPRNTIADIDDPAPNNTVIDAHGTACAGLIVAAHNNQIGVSGVCPDCSWMPVRLLDGGQIMSQLSEIAEGLYWAVDHGAWVMSNSWYISQEAIDAGTDITPLKDAIREAVANGRGGKGSVVLFAAGNADEEIGPDELSAMPETIAVGGSDHYGFISIRSAHGPSLWVVAPTWSGYVGDPRIVTLDVSGDVGYNQQGERWYYNDQGEEYPTGDVELDPEGNYTAFFGGTSAATPIAAGVAALVLSANPDLTYLEVMEILRSTADKIGGVEYDQDGHHDRYGYGRVHAERAVAVALYGTDNPDGNLCRLDLNCENECLPDPPIGEGPVCATACAATPECGDSRICLEGYCYPEFLLLLIDDDCEPEPRVRGNCAHARGDSVWFLLLMGLLLYRRRRSTA